MDEPSIEPDLVESAIASPDLCELLQNDVVVGLLSDVQLTRFQRSMLHLEMIIVISVRVRVRREIHLRSHFRR
jgi:hypothetical protein